MKSLLLIIFNFWVTVYSIQIPNRKFVANTKNPSSDLCVINPSQASFISRHWLNAIVTHNPTIAIEDRHIVRQINALETYFQESTLEKDLYLVWMPKGDVKEPLIIIVSTVDVVDGIMRINMVVQSPLWSNNQVESIALKKSLETLAADIQTQINFDELYKTEPRYKLEWETWF